MSQVGNHCIVDKAESECTDPDRSKSVTDCCYLTLCPYPLLPVDFGGQSLTCLCSPVSSYLLMCASVALYERLLGTANFRWVPLRSSSSHLCSQLPPVLRVFHNNLKYSSCTCRGRTKVTRGTGLASTLATIAGLPPATTGTIEVSTQIVIDELGREHWKRKYGNHDWGKWISLTW